MKHQIQNFIKSFETRIFLEREKKNQLNNLHVNATHGKKLVVTLFLLCLILSIGNAIFGHGVVVSNVSITGQNTTNGYTLVQFDISWDNSWRVSSGPENWDACWVFVKYRLKTQTIWNHATLNTSGHTAPANSTISTPSDGKGIFIYRSADLVQGSVSYPGTQLRWNYGIDGIADDDSVEICVFAIEMVYVPQGSFYVGDGTSVFLQGQFESGTSGTPFQITSEGALTLGGGVLGSLGNNNASGMASVDNFNDATSQTLPADFPKGYAGFYCMKYSITQEQYVVFLNKLTREQQNTRTATALGVGTIAVTNRYVMSNSSTMSNRNGIRCDDPIDANDPITFYCDFNGNDTPNEAGDGQNIACNYLSWGDLAAYLDWAALRPMTELEYEKACRGNQSAVANEYAWGSTSITQATGISNSGADNETASNAGANCAYDNHASVPGPMRVGNFGQGVNTRAGVGASYYGIMELSGNLWERPVTVGIPPGRAFTGTHGNGSLDATGNADATNWPGTNGSGAGFRGGQFQTTPAQLRVSSRVSTNAASGFRSWTNGGRGVRLEP